MTTATVGRMTTATVGLSDHKKAYVGEAGQLILETDYATRGVREYAVSWKNLEHTVDPIETYFELVPEGWADSTAARHRAHRAALMAQPGESVDIDLPMVYEGTDW